LKMNMVWLGFKMVVLKNGFCFFLSYLLTHFYLYLVGVGDVLSLKILIIFM
jgi:hypothetical protein